MQEIIEGVFHHTFTIQWCDRYNFVLAEKTIPMGIHIGMPITPIQSGVVDYIRVLDGNESRGVFPAINFEGYSMIKGSTILLKRFDFVADFDA